MNSGNQLVTAVSEGKELVRHRLVEAGPVEAAVGVAETLMPVGSVAEPVDVLRRFLEREADQGIRVPVAGQDAPYRASIGIEVPLARRIEGFPVDLQRTAIAEILLYRADGFDRHHRKQSGLDCQRAARVFAYRTP